MTDVKDLHRAVIAYAGGAALIRADLLDDVTDELRGVDLTNRPALAELLQKLDACPR